MSSSSNRLKSPVSNRLGLPISHNALKGEQGFYHLALGLSPLITPQPQIHADASTMLLEDELNLEEEEGAESSSLTGMAMDMPLVSSSPISPPLIAKMKGSSSDIHNGIISTPTRVKLGKPKNEEDDEYGINETRETLSRILNDESLESSNSYSNHNTVNILDQLQGSDDLEYENCRLKDIQDELGQLKQSNEESINELKDLLAEIEQLKINSTTKIESEATEMKSSHIWQRASGSTAYKLQASEIRSNNPTITNLIGSVNDLLELEINDNNEMKSIGSYNDDLSSVKYKLLKSLKEVATSF
ncbi:hypothetical protein CANARDRAFT_212342 [[Candida] arabinofermentans NRRL YB-2248]|uniref:Uncharacterized protein n=1 Tax=[Candida] arabinofermentans NRRL YB-2248 TaxID=983967 RepID=A0A1E4T2U1_9ASCO|nr:hypothetical protein CANARDRAFT_212342 [[Candida] arabinofermentans NRRL YB-2248]